MRLLLALNKSDMLKAVMTLCKTSGHCYLVYVNCSAYDVVCVACNKFYQVRWFNICLMVNIDSKIGRLSD